MRSSQRFPVYGWVSLCVFVSAQILLLLGVEPVGYWFYPVAWWSYIVVADGLVYRQKGTSLLMHHRGEFLLLLPWSLCFWLIFELFNVALNNWHYVMVPENLLQRWSGYAVCYATVLPGLFETMELLESWGLFKDSRVTPIPVTSRWYLPFAITGVVFLTLPLFWPRFFFPLVWGGFIFVLEPINHRLGVRSLMREWEQGSLRTFYLLLGAGAVCGLLWEFWNYWALTKWVYTVPYVGWLKIFEMPILGFLGFPPFAVECYVMMNTVSLLRQGRGWQDPDAPAAKHSPVKIVLISLAVTMFSLFVFHQIDQHTIASWRP